MITNQKAKKRNISIQACRVFNSIFLLKLHQKKNRWIQINTMLCGVDYLKQCFKETFCKCKDQRTVLMFTFY